MSKLPQMKVLVAESSLIVRSGLTAVLKRLPDLNTQPVEVASPEALCRYLSLHHPDAVIVNPTFGGWFDLTAFKAEHSGQPVPKFVAVLTSVVAPDVLKNYDEHFSILDDMETISGKMHRLLHEEEEDDNEHNDGQEEVLSQREKEIVTCVVKGLTNKEIAEQLFLSVHTVITHRRNIARKLQIHSPAGLTIYAIVNKLVELNEVKDL
ncbi:MAG: response regulator transcription factor [Bacteroides sp.]|nr:response regulator transcription factor [Bacteroides sp.]